MKLSVKQESSFPIFSQIKLVAGISGGADSNPYYYNILPMSNFVTLQERHPATLFKIHMAGSSHRGATEMNSTSNHEVAGSIPGLAQWVKDSALP